MSLLDYQTLVDSLVRDDTGKITPSDRDEAIQRAVERYSKDRPRTHVEEIVAADGHFQVLPPNWEADFSSLQSIEHPVGEYPPSYLDIGSYGMYHAPGANVLQIAVRAGFSAGDTVRIGFTIRHVVDASSDSTPSQDREAIACWAGAVLLDQLASLFSGDSDSTIQADVVDHGSRAGEFARRAKALRTRYYDELGIDPKRNVAHGVVVDLDWRDSRGRDRLTHPGRYR